MWLSLVDLCDLIVWSKGKSSDISSCVSVIALNTTLWSTTFLAELISNHDKSEYRLWVFCILLKIIYQNVAGRILISGLALLPFFEVTVSMIKIWKSKMCIPRRIIFPSRQRRSIYYHISETDQYLDTNYFKRNLIENKKMAT